VTRVVPTSTHIQAVPQTTWVISHKTNCYPLVNVILHQELVEPDIFYPDSNTIIIEFAEPTAGIAVMKVPALTHTQSVPQATWTISHQITPLPSVAVIVNQELVKPDIFYPNATTVTIAFAEATAGIAVLV